jgi:hypothetical protein
MNECDPLADAEQFIKSIKHLKNNKNNFLQGKINKRPEFYNDQDAYCQITGKYGTPGERPTDNEIKTLGKKQLRSDIMIEAAVRYKNL